MKNLWSLIILLPFKEYKVSDLKLLYYKAGCQFNFIFFLLDKIFTGIHSVVHTIYSFHSVHTS